MFAFQYFKVDFKANRKKF